MIPSVAQRTLGEAVVAIVVFDEAFQSCEGELHIDFIKNDVSTPKFLTACIQLRLHGLKKAIVHANVTTVCACNGWIVSVNKAGDKD